MCLAQSELRHRCHQVPYGAMLSQICSIFVVDVCCWVPGMIAAPQSWLVNGMGYGIGFATWVLHFQFDWANTIQRTARQRHSGRAAGPSFFPRRGQCFRPFRLLRNFRYPPHGALHITFRRSNRFRPKQDECRFFLWSCLSHFTRQSLTSKNTNKH